MMFARSPSNPGEACLLVCAQAAAQVGTRQHAGTSQTAWLPSILCCCLPCDEFQIRNALVGDQDHGLWQQSDPNLNLNSIAKFLCDIDKVYPISEFFSLSHFPWRRWNQDLVRKAAWPEKCLALKVCSQSLLNTGIFHFRVICYFKMRRRRQILMCWLHHREKLKDRSQEGLVGTKPDGRTTAQEGLSRMMPQTRLAWAIEQVQS